jgi:hypothetical protein
MLDLSWSLHADRPFRLVVLGLFALSCIPDRHRAPGICEAKRGILPTKLEP